MYNVLRGNDVGRRSMKDANTCKQRSSIANCMLTMMRTRELDF